MTAAWTQVLLILAVLARPSAWPGDLEADGRAVADLPEEQGPPGNARRSGMDAHRRGADAHRPGADAQWPGMDAQRLGPEALRLGAMDRLCAKHGLVAATPFLLPLLADADPAVRLYAARLLARADVPAAGAVALAWIARPAVPLVDRALGLDVLTHAATLPPPARAIVEQAVRDPEPATRLQALEVLAGHPIGPSLPAVLGAVDDDNRDVRLAAVRLAGADGDPRAALPLLDRVDDGDRQTRLQAIAALGRLGEPRVVPTLLRLVGEGAPDERATAIDALGALKATTAVRSLTALAGRQTDELARHALSALGEIATPPAVDALVAALRSAPLSADAQIGLRHAGAAALAALVGEIEHGTPATESIAGKLLGDLGDRHATPLLCAVLERSPEAAPAALAALDALAMLRDPAAVPTLARAAESADVESRRRAFAALVALADARSLDLLDGGLTDPDPQVRLLATRLATSLDAHGAALALATRLADAVPVVRTGAALALARVADDQNRPLAAVLTELTRADAPARDDDETAAIGDALEAMATGDDAEALARAYPVARGGARGAIARGLAVAHATRPLSDPALVGQLIAAVGEGGPTALAVADALAVARIPAGAVGTLARAFGDAEPMVRARLCPAIAGTPDGGAWLAALLETPGASPEVRAAAAWAARGSPDARSALESAALGAGGAVAGNARAALLAGARAGTAWAAVRLRTPDGAPVIGRWVAIGEAGGIEIQVATDCAGVARFAGLSDALVAGGRLGLRAAGLTPRGAP